jgi:TolB-like protein/DNA-binding winged helix-turn-helix (wHTH) protein
MAAPFTVIYEFDRFRLDRGNQRLTRDGLLLITPGRTLPLLADLLERRGRIITIAKLIDSHFPKSRSGEEQLTGAILQLKQLLDDTSKEPPLVRFIPGEGYQFEGDVTEYLGDSASDQNFGTKPEALWTATPARNRPKSNKSILGIAAALVAFVAIGFGIWRFTPSHASSSSDSVGSSSGTASSDSPVEFSGIPQVAILPFQSLTGQATDDSFNRRLTEAIFSALSKQSAVKVVPAQDVQRYLESGVADPVTAGQRLGAQMIVRGMAQRLAGHIVVKVQLLNTQDGSQIWSIGFDGDPNDVTGLAAKISEKIIKGAQR